MMIHECRNNVVTLSNGETCPRCGAIAGAPSLSGAPVIDNSRAEFVRKLDEYAELVRNDGAEAPGYTIADREVVHGLIADVRAEVLRLYDAATAVQGGEWVMVPREPSEAMCRAAVIYANGNAVYKNVAAEALQIEEGIYAEVYAAMLSAAPPKAEAVANDLLGLCEAANALCRGRFGVPLNDKTVNESAHAALMRDAAATVEAYMRTAKRAAPHASGAEKDAQ